MSSFFLFLPSSAMHSTLRLSICSLVFLITICTAQKFPHSSYDVTFSGVSAACTNALNATLSCRDLLGVLSFNGQADLSENDLSALCVTSCADSLALARSTIVEQCTAATDVLKDGDSVYPATWILDEFLYTFNRTCRKDSSTGEFCGVLFQLWMNESALTTDQECSDCMLGVQQTQLNSPFGYSDTFAGQFNATTSSCGKTGYSYMSPTPYTIVTGTPTTSSASSTPTTCSTRYTIAQGDTCNSIAIAQSVSTFSLLYENKLLAYCAHFPNPGTELCIPPICDIYTVKANQTCRDIVQDQSSYITVAQLQAWNYNLDPLCTDLSGIVGTQVCVSPPGQLLNSTPNNTNPDATNVTTPVLAPTNVGNGTNPRCGKYYTVQAGDYCSLLAVQFSITLDNFLFLNPEINTNCTNLLLGYAYCVQPVGSIITYSDYPGAPTPDPCASAWAPSTCFGDSATLTSVPYISPNETYTRPNITTPTTVAPLSPTASGTVGGCLYYREYRTVNGSASAEAAANSCSFVANFYGITVDDLVSWNPSLSADQCVFQKELSYCVLQKSLTTSAAASTTTNDFCVADPTAIPSGTSSNCNCYIEIYGNDKDYYNCTEIASGFKISVAQIVSLNPWAGSDCSGLYSNLSGDDARDICVAGGGTATATTPTTSSNPIPGPTQTGIVAGCTGYYVVVSGDSCGSIGSTYQITFAQFYSWNPAVDSNCGSLWVGYAYCVAGPASTATTSTATPTTTTPTTTSSAIPGPTQTGIVAGCTGYYVVVSGDSCASIESAYHITFAQFYNWNPAVDSNCGSLWVGYAYCVVGPASTATTTTSTPTTATTATTTTTTTSSIPGPTQTGITSTCNKYVIAVAGDSCWSISNTNGITLDQFYAWNPAVGTDCASLWGGYAYCVGVTG